MKFSAVLLLFVLYCENGISRYTNKNSRHNANPRGHNSTIKYYTDLPPRVTIPIMIHLDKTLTKDLTKDHKKTIRKYFHDVLKKVETLYKHPSLNESIHFNLLGVKTLRNATKKFQMNEDVSKYLRSYCQWQGVRKIKEKKWYYSVLFTGLNVYYLDGKNNKVRTSTGRGYMRGICSLRNSCTILEWHPQNIAYIMAHEVAHSLGVTHDGAPYNQCRQRYIMSDMYHTRSSAAAWSPCTKHGFTKLLK